MIGPLTTALADRLQSLPDAERRRWHGVILCVALYLFHATWFSTWFIEDAAISFAYARNLAAGDGLVTNPGGAWVEGFSNPTWTLLLALLQALGISPWIASKVCGVGFGAATLPLAYLWARRLGPDEPGTWPVLAPLVLALSTQFTLWTASGLENGLFGLLLAASAVRLLAEGDAPRSGVPSGLLLAGLAITRPEGPMYGGLIAVIGGGMALRAGGLRWAAGFLLGGLGPFVAWHAWRVWAFAWPFPNTYYAKQTDEKFAPLVWSHRGWSYVRSWALVSTHGFLLPLFTLGQTGLRGNRALAGLVLTGMLVGTLLPGVGWLRDLLPFPPEPEAAIAVRVGALALGVAVFPAIGLGRVGATARTLAWSTACAALFFALYTGGDWMKGFRWMSMASVPLAVLLADAARTVSEAVRPAVEALPARLRRPAWVPVLLVLPALGGGVGQTVDFLFGIETSPYDVRRRVLYMQGVQRRLHLDRASLLEVDMGAHMLWSGFEMFDMAGLCDVPIARHHYQPAFVDAYLHDENRPTFAHVHGGWATRTKIDKRPWFDDEYVEIPGYGHSFQQFHVGNHVRRDTFVQDGWDGDSSRRTAFGTLILEGLDTLAPVVSPGGALYVELGWSIRRRTQDFRAILFLSDGERLVVKELPPAYDWIPVPQWRTGQVFVGRHTVSLPDDLPVGTWDLGIAVFDEGVDGRARRAIPQLPSGAVDLGRVVSDPRLVTGEARWDGVIEVRPRDEVAERATVGLGEAVLAARDGACERAEARWASARRHLPAEDPWHHASDPAFASEAALCWAHRAEKSRDPDDIRRARQHDFRNRWVREIASELADRYQDAGDRAMAAGDEEGAWRGWSDTLTADPARSWVRRRLELLRVRRLGLEEVK